MSYINTQASTAYQEAITATNAIEEPAIGFAKPADFTGAQLGTKCVIKQNNLQIELLAKILSEVTKVKEVLEQIKKEKAKEIPEDLITGLKNLKLGPTKEKSGLLRVYKNPKTLLEAEKSKQ
ncbi:ORF2 [Aglaonema bacilliform virus]|uniref:ORF2 n=1 Tax=Aglaonema bacilliform virus TaxID=1512278 RepID=A0A411F6T8_9VIRU|nr:ORF2 [Aglaonema bacilliform virus]QBA88840.1 ORF2 [Aglaonema bacilliform virus]